MSYQNVPDHRLRPLLERLGAACQVEPVPLEQLKKEIYQYGKRRCDVEGSLDNLKYHLGFAFEVNSALDLPSLALTGLLSLPVEAFTSLFDDVGELPPTVIDLLRFALDKPFVLAWATDMGAWLQWKRSEAVYRAEVTDFKNSDAFHRSGWRTRSVTRRQFYLIGEINRLLGIEPRLIVNRGEAFDFIDRHGGNPRFLTEPALPAQWWS